MFIRDLENCDALAAGDETILRQVLHPDKADLVIRYSLAHAAVKPGRASRPHRLKSSEVYYILEGEGVLHIGDESATVFAGHAIYVPPCAEQYIENSGDSDLKFLCIVDPAGKAEDEEISG